MWSRQAATGSGSSSRVQNATASQSRSTSGSPNTCVGPAAGRIRDAGPVDRALDHLLADDLVDLLHPRASDPLAVEVGQQLRLRIARRRDQRVAGHRAGERLLPLRGVGQRLVGAELDHRLADVRIAVLDVDVRRAGLVGRPCVMARASGACSMCASTKTVCPSWTFAPTRTARLGVAGEPFLRAQSCHASSRRIGTSLPSAVTPSTATSGPPIMKSVCTEETLMPRSRSSSGVRPSMPSIPKVTAEP